MNTVLVGFPNRNSDDFAKRLAVGVSCSGLTNTERLQVLSGTLTLDALKQAKPDLATEIDTVSGYFLCPWSSDGGATENATVGVVLLTDQVWARLQARLADLPANVKYARWFYPDAGDWREAILMESNSNKQVIGSQWEGVSEALAREGIIDFEVRE